MPLFQQSVQKKYIKDLDKAKVETAYQKLIAHFGNIDVQENIRKAKEEQYQEGFLRELFVDVLGYVLNPQPNYNLITEQKNEKNSKKADGAILKNNKPIAIIELKSIKTTDLQSIEIQAFNYKNNQSECVYVITSNFQKIRFYIENAVDFEEFDLFDLSKERFELLYLCLQVDNILSDLPLRIKQASLEREENITKKLYADYSLFKQTLFKDITAQNRDLDKLTLFKKTQKLLDRFLFIFFAEDKGLLPPNSVSEILNQWDKLKELDEYQPLYSRFKKYFGYLNSGHKGKHYDIFAYNGGLFAPDDLLDNLKITDNILYNHCRVLSHYDFDTEVDTNILGHIFEHSLNEVDEVAANTEGVNLDKGKTKRKKDGIFYTPRYITKYIVESTIGELCKQKKLILGLDNEALIKADTKKDRKLYQVKIGEYRKWLLQLTILDPACGSGAFLNQALEFLIQEHRLVDTMTAMLFGDSLIMTDNVTEILENNIFGVDINEESVEIARLALWLRTAKVGRKLNDLSRHIKCGNSLVSDNIVAGDLAFDWQKAFPQVFANGGFDVIIGNPPYVDIKAIDNKIVECLFKTYTTAENRINLYSIFIEKGYNLLKNNGFLSFINPNSILVNSSYTKIRKLLLSDVSCVIKLPDDVFPDAKVETIIFGIKKNNTSDTIDTIVYQRNQIIGNVENSLITKVNRNTWTQDSYNIHASKKEVDILEKIGNQGVKLDIIADFTLGITPYDKYRGHSEDIIKNRKFHSSTQNDETYKPLIGGENVVRYFVSDKSDEYIRYGDWLGAMRQERFFTEPRIIIRQIVSGNPPRIYAGYTEKPLYYTQIGFGIIAKKDSQIENKYLLCILNSQLMTFYHKYKYLDIEKDLFQKILIANCKDFPIKKIAKSEQSAFIKLADSMLLYNEEIRKQSKRFTKLLQSSFSKLTVNKKIETWYEMKFGEFRKELEKQKIAIPIKELMDYQDLFDTNATQIKEIQTKINNTEKAIDKLVYALYDLTSEEIQVIENQ
jgi:hypothetical protein